MSGIQAFLITFSTAAVLENAIFSRALGLNRWARKQDSLKQILLYGGLFGWVSILSTMGSYFMNWVLSDIPIVDYLRAPAYLIVVSIVYLLTYYLAVRFFKDHFEEIISKLPITTFNTALFSVFFIMTARKYTFSRSIAYALGTSVGYTVALLLLMFANRRLELSPIPRSFKGLPVTLIYMGLISLALYGLLGYGVSA